MDDIRFHFRTRSLEITRYLSTLKFIDEQGVELSSARGDRKRMIDITTRHVLKASVFLHLYNLIESTVSACLSRVSEEIGDKGLHFGDLVEEWQTSWLRELGKTSQPLSEDARLKNVLRLCTDVLNRTPILFKPTVRGGNLDDQRIEKLLVDHGLVLTVPPKMSRLVKKHVVDDHGPLSLIKVRRNQLAHGLTSFADCGKDVSVPDLRRWAATVILYLRVILDHFEQYLLASKFMRSKP